jgi:hypothetical protein
MRFIGIILALGAIGWVLYQASGVKEDDGAIPQGYQQSMEKAQDVEQTVQDAAQQRLQELDQLDQ